MASSTLRFLDHTQRRITVGFLWKGDQPVAESSLLKYTTLTTDKHPFPGRNSNPHFQQPSDRRPIP